MGLKKFKLYGKDKGKKNFRFLGTRMGRTKSSTMRSLKKRSGFHTVKVKEI